MILRPKTVKVISRNLIEVILLDEEGGKHILPLEVTHQHMDEVSKFIDSISNRADQARQKANEIR